MLDKIIDKFIKSFIFCFILAIICIVILFFIESNKPRNIEKIYKNEWNIDIIKPYSSTKIYYSSSIDGADLMYIHNYKQEDIEILKEKDYFKKMDIGSVYKLLSNDFTTLDRDCACVSQYKVDEYLNEDNYYAFFNGKSHHTLLILDTTNNSMYEFSTNDDLKTMYAN